MKPIKKIDTIAIVICGHGSRNKSFQIDFLKFVTFIETYFRKYKTYYCFIEINKPLIDESLNGVMKNHNKIIFIPALILKGKHFKDDINKRIKEILEKKTSTKLVIIKNLELNNNVVSIFANIIKNKLTQRNLLITLCSNSKERNISEDIMNYTNNIAQKLNIKNSISTYFGNENEIQKKIDLIIRKENIKRIVLHPIFLFNGFLYQKTKEKFKKIYSDKLVIIKPMLSYDKMTEIIVQSIKSEIKLLK